jgi:hypothetical protein
LGFKLNTTFHVGEVEKKELEKLISDVITNKMPGIIVFKFSYREEGIVVQTSQGEIEIDIDWEEIIIKE